MEQKNWVCWGASSSIQWLLSDALQGALGERILLLYYTGTLLYFTLWYRWQDGRVCGEVGLKVSETYSQTYSVHKLENLTDSDGDQHTDWILQAVSNLLAYINGLHIWGLEGNHKWEREEHS